MKTKFYAVVATEDGESEVTFTATRKAALRLALDMIKDQRRSDLRKQDAPGIVLFGVTIQHEDSRSLAAKAATLGRRFEAGELSPALGAEWDDSAQKAIDQAWQERREGA